MKQIYKTLLAIFLVTLLAPQAIFCQSVDKMIDEVDEYYKQFNNEKALEILKKAEKAEPNNFEVVWRLSRTYIDIGEKMPASTSQQEEAQLASYQKALEYAEKSVKINENNSIGFLRKAIANGRIALFKGVFSVGGMVNSVKADVEKAIQLNNGGNFIQGVAHYVLARTHLKTSEKWKPARSVLGLGWADNEIAISEFKKAIQLYPNYIMFYVDYAHSLIREKEYKTAREMLNKALKTPIAHQEDEKRLAEAKKILNDIKDE
ncbi:MAG: Tetratricopeptide TPR2 repeat protein [Ignavibacteria bacterium]|nr:MAG: Tetratricopeptide TPR2 repeat protein [Ignavibacteria bacterium]KAF0158872.1 MAG: Tetratricopeptide TPR2 repeat protein [Ignavibacteria bacterium]